jgi:hypothetical protein
MLKKEPVKKYIRRIKHKVKVGTVIYSMPAEKKLNLNYEDTKS